MLIPGCTSGEDVYVLATDALGWGVGRLGPWTWCGPPGPGLQSRALCGAVCALSIAIVLY